MAPSAQDETEKEQEAIDTSPAWLEQLAINLPEVDEEEQRIQRENYQRDPILSETELLHSTDIFQLADLLKPVSKEDYDGKWFSRLLTDHTFEVDFDEKIGPRRIDLCIHAVGLQGIIPDRVQVAIICHHYHPSVVTIITGRVRNYRLRKYKFYEFGSHLSIEQPDRFEFNDYLFGSMQLLPFPLAAPSSTWGQVKKHMNDGQGRWVICSGCSRNSRIFDVSSEIPAFTYIYMFILGHNLWFKTEVHDFEHVRGLMFSQESVFWMGDGRFEELGAIFEW